MLVVLRFRFCGSVAQPSHRIFAGAFSGRKKRKCPFNILWETLVIVQTVLVLMSVVEQENKICEFIWIIGKWNSGFSQSKCC